MGYDFAHESLEFQQVLDALQNAVEAIHSEFCGHQRHHPACEEPYKVLAIYRPEFVRV